MKGRISQKETQALTFPSLLPLEVDFIVRLPFPALNLISYYNQSNQSAPNFNIYASNLTCFPDLPNTFNPCSSNVGQFNSVRQLQFYLMSVSKQQSFLRQYAKSGYLDKMNPEFDGIARKYYNEKKEHEKVHSIKVKLDKEVAFMERMERRIEKKLEKKEVELRYAKEVKDRFHSDLQKREWIHDYHSKELKNNKQKATFIKSQSMQRIKQAHQYLLEHKKSLANLNRGENQKIKEAMMLKKAQEWDSNRGRASQIYQFKKDVKESCNKFYQSRTGSSLKQYQARINSFKEYKNTDHENIKSLEKRLAELSKHHTEKKEKATELSKQIQQIKHEAKLESNLIRTRLRSHSSMSSISNRSEGQSSKRKSEMAIRSPS